jgi:hypothetical protein
MMVGWTQRTREEAAATSRGVVWCRRRAAGAGSTDDCQRCFREVVLCCDGYDRLSGVLQVLVEIALLACCLNLSGRGCTAATIAGTTSAFMTISSPRLSGDEQD